MRCLLVFENRYNFKMFELFCLGFIYKYENHLFFLIGH